MTENISDKLKNAFDRFSSDTGGLVRKIEVYMPVYHQLCEEQKFGYKFRKDKSPELPPYLNVNYIFGTVKIYGVEG